MKNKRFIGVILVLATLFTLILPLFGCNSGNKWTNGKDTPSDNPLAGYAEVVEFNKNSVIPELMGTPSEQLGSGYEMRSGVVGHIETHQSADYMDVTYTLGTREMHFEGETDTPSLYVTAVRILSTFKTVKQVNGRTVTDYNTERSFLGVQVGNSYEAADKKFTSFGYKKIYEEEAKTTRVPTSREIAYQKGIIIISLAVEANGEISGMYAWVPYDTSEIDALLADSHLPCNLGLIYNCYGSTDPVFRYAAKNEDATARIYIADDGTNALMRGYPDRHDIIMCADILFSSDRYDIDGAKVGMTFRECIDILTSKGWVLQKDSSTLVKEMLCIKLYDAVPESILSDPGTVIGSDELTVNAMRILLSASSNMEAYNPEK